MKHYFSLTDTFLVALLAGGHSHPSAFAACATDSEPWICMESCLDNCQHSLFPINIKHEGSFFSVSTHLPPKCRGFFPFSPSTHNSGLMPDWQPLHCIFSFFFFFLLLCVIGFTLNNPLGLTATSLYTCHIIIITVWKKCLILNKSRARLHHFLLHFSQKKHHFWRKTCLTCHDIVKQLTAEYRVVEAAQQTLRISSQGQRLVNTAKLVLNIVQQRAPDNANYNSSVLSCGDIHPSSSARGILQDFPFEWEIDGDLSSLYHASASLFLPCEHQPRSFRLLRSTFSSAAAAERQKAFFCFVR